MVFNLPPPLPLEAFELAELITDDETLLDPIPRGGNRLSSYANGLGGMLLEGESDPDLCVENAFVGGNNSDVEFCLMIDDDEPSLRISLFPRIEELVLIILVTLVMAVPFVLLSYESSSIVSPVPSELFLTLVG